MGNVMMRSVRFVLGSCLLCALGANPATAAPPVAANGLPLWEIAVYTGFPVRIVLGSPAELAELLAAVPIASFNREQVSPAGTSPFDTSLIFEPRVSESEMRDLERAGYAPLRLPDAERMIRREMERVWSEQALEGGDSFLLGDRGVYHTHAQAGAILQQAEADHPAIADYFVMGYSVQGRELHMIRISDNVGVEEAEPEIRLSSTMHGNEPPGMEMLLFLVDYLTDNYGQPGFDDVTYLVDNYEIHILPLMNPDGHVVSSRYNAHGIDLNRNFPVPDGSIGNDNTWVIEPETQQFMDYGFAHNFVISENAHAGALVVNYPWDYTYALTPDDEAIILLSEEYSYYNLPMWNGDWYHGITNGAQWYRTWGCLQDWSYHETGCIDVTIEISDSFQPPSSWLDGMWDDNRESFMHWMMAARYGVNGVVTDAITGDPLAATVTIAGNAKQVFGDPDFGDYYKLLETGSWDITFAAPDHIPQTFYGVSTVWGTPTVLDVQLISDTVGLSDAPAAATAYMGAYPNPFNPKTTLRFRLARAGEATLTVHDMRGRQLRRLVGETLPAGEHVTEWDGRDEDGQELGSGMYLVRLRAAGTEESGKLILLK